MRTLLNCLSPGSTVFRSAMFLRCMSPSAINQAKRARRRMMRRSSSGAVDNDRTARATRSIVPSYFASVGRSSTEQRSSNANIRLSLTLSRISKRSTSKAGGIPSGMAINAVAGTTNPAARPRARAIHSITGKASNPPVLAGFRIWVNGVPVLGESIPLASRCIGALIWIPESRGVSACS